MQATIKTTEFSAIELDQISEYAINIRLVLRAATVRQTIEGTQWYAYAEQFAERVAIATGISKKQAAYVIAALSNNVSWEKQLDHTIPLVLAALDGLPMPGPFIGGCKKIAQQIICEKDYNALRGPKVTVFARNILGDYSGVTVDRWALRVALGRFTDDDETKKWVRPGKRRALIEAAYHLVADQESIAPAILQAITWTVIRGASGF